MEEAFRNIEAPNVLEAVQQPVGVGGIAARLELPEPDEPRHVGVGRLFEQMLEVSPEPGRNRSAMRASIRRSASTSASAQSRSIVVVAGRMVRSFDCAFSASSRSRSTSSRAAPPEKDRNPYSSSPSRSS